ncbi:MAG: hypothetical protein ACQKBV_06345 [Puniceicoccales bacterium]
MTLEIPEFEIEFDDMVDESALMGLDDTISIDFPRERVVTIIRNVADLYNLNVVIPSSLAECEVSIKLRDVHWEDVFWITLEPCGYTYSVEGVGGNIVLIKPIEHQSTVMISESWAWMGIGSILINPLLLGISIFLFVLLKRRRTYPVGM